MLDAGSTRCDDGRARQWVLVTIFLLGFSCMATQLVLLRELLCVFGGNELVLGIVLGNWLALMGIGASLGRFAKRLTQPLRIFVWAQVLVALLPVIAVFGARWLRIGIFTHGATVGIYATIVSTLFVLLPYCLTAGFMLTLACSICSRAPGSETSAGRVYVADSIGSVLGGAVFSLLLVWVVDTFALLAVVGLLMLVIAGVIAWRERRKWVLASIAAWGALLALGVWCLQLDARTTRLRFIHEEILFRGNSPYGQLVVTAAGGQLNFVQNGLPILSTHNTEQVEEAAHYAMAQRPEARRVLLVGGGVAGTARELLKYRAEVTYAELDPLLLKQGWHFLAEHLDDPHIRIVNTDGRRFVQTTDESFDVIIVDVPDPVTAQLNRLHTAEFLSEAKRVLTPNGLLALPVGQYGNIISPPLARMLATAHQTLRGVFTNVVVLPGRRVFFLASDGIVGTNIAERLERAQIRTRFVNRHYLDAMLMPDRLADVQRAVRQEAAVNRDFNPVLYFQCLQHWASQFDEGFRTVGVGFALAFAVYLVRLRGPPAALFASGFAASSLEVVLLLGFQALCGSLYYQLGILITMFMVGLAAGAAWANRWEQDFSRGRLLLLAAGIVLFALLLPLTLAGLSRLPAFRTSQLGIQITFNAMTFLLAALVGAEFPVANRVTRGDSTAIASRLYTADFLGASLGALLASAWLIPTLGVTKMCWLAAGFNLLGAAAVLLTPPKPARVR